MKNQGWVKIYRQLMDTSFYRNSAVVHLFVHLLIMSNHTKHKFLLGGEEIEVDSGQLVTGRKTLSEQTGISVQTIRTCLSALKSTKVITILPTPNYSVITICNWKDYQGVTNQPTNHQPTINQPSTTYNKDKNDNIIEILKKPSHQTDEKKTNRLLNLVGNPVLCTANDSQKGCGKCANCSLTVLTSEQIYNMAVKKRVDYQDIKRTQDSLIAWIQDGRMKSKTIYRTLSTWVDNAIMRSNIREISDMEVEMMELKYDNPVRRKLDEIYKTIEK